MRTPSWLTKLFRTATQISRNPVRDDRRRGFESLEARMVLSVNWGDFSVGPSAPSDRSVAFDEIQQVRTFRSDNGQASLARADFSFTNQDGTPYRGKQATSFEIAPSLSEDFGLQPGSIHLATVESEFYPGSAADTLTLVIVQPYRRNFPAFVRFVEFDASAQLAQSSGESAFRPLLTTTGADLDVPGLPIDETVVQGSGDALENPGISPGNDRLLSSATIVLPPLDVSYVSYADNAEVISAVSVATTEPINNQPIVSIESSSLLLPGDINPSFESAFSDSARDATSSSQSDPLVDIGRLDESSVSQQPSENFSQQKQSVSDLLEQLHEPPARSIQQYESPLPGPTQSAELRDDKLSGAGELNDEGGMVLFQAAQHAVSNDLLLVDAAFAAWGTLDAEKVRMEAAIGAFRAFDVGSSVGMVVEEAVHPSSSSRPGTQRSSDVSGEEKKTRTSAVTTNTMTGVIASSAVAVAVKRNLNVIRVRKARQKSH